MEGSSDPYLLLNHPKSVPTIGFPICTLLAIVSNIEDVNVSDVLSWAMANPELDESIREISAEQMTLEGLILQKQGFSNVQSSVHNVDSLRFWKLSGGLEAGKEYVVKGRNVPEIEVLLEEALAGLENLIQEFEKEETPYYSLPDSRKTPPEEWQDYAQLARVQEWATLDDGEVA